MRADKRGFTLIEILMALSVMGVILFITFNFFGSFRSKDALEKDEAALVSLIRNARLLSVVSKNALPYGIHLEASKAVLFEGVSYVAGGPNQQTVEFNKLVYLQNYNLNQGTPDIVFARLTGNTLNYGTIVLALKDLSTSTTITILQTGVIQ